MRKRTVAALTALVVVAGCDFGNGDQVRPRRSPLASPTSESSLIVGLVGTVSGPDAWRGEDAIEGADFAVGMLNRNLGPNDPPYELYTLDDRGDPGRATRLVEQVAAIDRTVGVIYAGPPEGLAAAEGALAEAGVPALLAYGDLYGARRLTPHVFQLSPSYIWEARRLVAYLVGDRGYRRLGVLVERSAQGRVAERAVTGALRLLGRGISVTARYGAPDGDPTGRLRRFKDRRVEAIIVHGGPRAMAEVLGSLRESGSVYRTTEAASLEPRPKRRRNKRPRPWRPQVAGFDAAISPAIDPPPVGTVAADTYGRGPHYLPIPELREFAQGFEEWWGERPLGWEQRAFQGVSALGWAVERAGPDQDLAVVLERLSGERFGALGATLGPDDHTFVGLTTVGLWVVPRPGVRFAGAVRLPDALPWVPLSRGFAIDGDTTDILALDWRYLFRKAPPKGAPAPKFENLRYGVSTTKRDPVH